MNDASGSRVHAGIAGRVRGERQNVLFQSDWEDELLLWCMDDLVACQALPSYWELADLESGFYVIDRV